MKRETQCGRFFVVLACLTICSASLRAATLYVGQGDSAQFKAVQAAVNAAVDGDIIIIDTGTYTGPGNCDIDLQSKSVTIQSANPLDPGIVETTVIDCGGTSEEPHRGFYVVGCGDATISGLTVTNGLASAGGAVYCKDSTLTMVSCRIVNNAALPGDTRSPAGGPGGGLYCEASLVKIVRCLIHANAAGAGAESQGGQGGNGGGICCVNSEVSVETSTITENRAGAGGAGDVAGAGGDGGGLYGGFVTLTNSTISQNVAGDGGRGGRGGGVFAETVVVGKCVIEANRAGTGDSGGNGGGIYSDSLEINNCLVVGNRAGAGTTSHGNGGGLWCASGEVRNCTIAGNSVFSNSADVDIKISASPDSGAGLFCTPSTVIVNSILYGNTPSQIAGHDCANVAYCNIEADECAGGANNVSREPQFVRSGRWAVAGQPDSEAQPQDVNAVWVQGDYRLQTQSPCLDAGDPCYASTPGETDLAGNPRLAAAAVDIGAYEFRNLVPIYRFWSPVTSRHFYTIDESERDRLISLYGHVWTYEGIAYYAYARNTDPNLMAVYRFWSDTLGGHFYTINEAERDNLINLYAHVWTFEGPVFYAYPDGGQPAGANAVYRFWSDQLSGHFYTINEAERDNLVNQYSHVWTPEGVAWYAHIDPNGVAPIPSKAGVFEFSAGADGASFTYILKAYVDGVEAKIDDPRMTFVAENGQAKIAVDFEAMAATIDDVAIESGFAQHTTTIRAGAQGEVVIPVTLSGTTIFLSAVPRGPYGIDPQTLAFPIGRSVRTGDNETFTLNGSVTVDGSKLDAGLAVRATRFSEGQGVFDDSSMPQTLDLRMTEPFQWSRTQREDRLIETTIKGNQLQLFITSAQVRMTGVWQGKQAE